MTTSPRSGRLLALACLCWNAIALTAQCDLQPRGLVPLLASDGTIRTTIAWDPDGPGPLGQRLVVGGYFRHAGGIACRNIAALDVATGTWEAIGVGLAGNNSSQEGVYSLAVGANGELLAGGQLWFQQSGSLLGNVARWTGTAWQPVGAGTFPMVPNALTVLPNGDVVAGGTQAATPTAAARTFVTRWNGSAWSQLGPDFALDQTSPFWASITSLAVLPGGDLVAGGWFRFAGGTVVNSVVRWDGTAWQPLGAGLQAVDGSPGQVKSMVVAGGVLMVGGSFELAGGQFVRVATWDGTNWSTLGNTGGIYADFLTVDGPGRLVAGGSGVFGGGLSRWDGSAWSPLDEMRIDLLGTLLDGRVFARRVEIGYSKLSVLDVGGWGALASGFLSDSASVLLQCADGVLLGGSYLARGSDSEARHLALLDANGCRIFAGGANGVVRAALTLANGDLIVGGSFQEVGGTTAFNLARHDGQQWTAFGDVLGAGLVRVNALVELSDGSLVIGGQFASVGGITALGVARWDGNSWAPLGAGIPVTVNALVELPDGDLLAACEGSIGVRRFDGTAWSQDGGLAGPARSLLVTRNGDVLAGGGRLSRREGSGWSEVGVDSPVTSTALVELPNGDLLASSGRVWRFDGSVWTSFGQDFGAGSLVVDPVGVVYCGGRFLPTPGGAGGIIGALVAPCPATTTSWGSGCASSGGVAVTLTARSLPWLGSTFAAGAPVSPSVSLALVVRGFQTVSLPLTGIAPSGCMLRVAPDEVAVAPIVAGSVETALAIPDTSALIGMVVHEQVLPVRLPAAGIALEVLASNRLSLTLGRF